MERFLQGKGWNALYSPFAHQKIADVETSRVHRCRKKCIAKVRLVAPVRNVTARTTTMAEPSFPALVRVPRFPGLVRHNHFLRAEPWPPPPKKQARPNK
jgi:hypothetical protein